MRGGLIHRPAPASVPMLATRADLSAHAPPPERNWQSGVDPTDPLGNDILGNCVEVATLRSIQVRLSCAGRSSWAPTRTTAVGLYTAWTGYDPARPSTDQGTDVVRAMTQWCREGYQVEPGLVDSVSWARVDPAQAGELRLAVELTGGVMLSLSLPRAIEGSDAWRVLPGPDPDTAPGSYAEHRVFCGRYDADGLWGITWGAEVPISWAFVAAYALAADSVLSWDWFDATGVTPAGLDRDAIAADMTLLTTGETT